MAPVLADAPAHSILGECGFATDLSAHYCFASSRPIGEGQYGVVYRAQHRATGKLVAIKVVNKDRADRTRSDHLQCIQHEVALWRMVQDCKFVVRLEGVFEDQHCVYLVQQLCTGGDLRSVLHSGQLTELEAAQVMRSVMEVMRACHRCDHVYGDLKPANLLLLHPHRTAGCQQFPQPKQRQQQQQQALAGAALSTAGMLGNNVAPLPLHLQRRHTETIREHLLASFLMPTVPGAASCSGQQVDAQALYQQQQLQTSSPRPNTSLTLPSSSPPPGGQGHATASTPGSPLASVRSAQMALRPQHPPDGAEPGGAKQSPQGGAGVAAVVDSPLALLRGAVLVDPLPPKGQPLHAAAGLRCSTKCHKELQVLVTDFGCCQQLCHQAAQGGEGGGDVTPRGALRQGGLTSGKRLGSPIFMAPEMWQAGALLNPGVDVWAAGVMLYQLISGRYPFWPHLPEQIDEGGLQLYQVVCGIQSNPICFQGEPWARVSKPCKDLLAAMLERQPQMRISAEGVLRHPWLAVQLGYSPAPPPGHDQDPGQEQDEL